MRATRSFFALVALTGTAMAQQPSDAQALIKQWTAQNTICRGQSGDLPDTQKACDERQRLGRALDAIGWCYGTKDQMGYQMQWHQCRADSNRYE